MLRTPFLSGLAAVSLTLSAAPLLADITVSDPYARASTSMSASGAAFMVIQNTGDTDDRLVSATAPVADRVELHTHEEDDRGVMRMIEVEEGFVIPAGGHHALARGGDHVMFLGLTQPLNDGDSVPVTLVFEGAGEITVDVPVDLNRKPMHGGGHKMMHGQGAPKTN